MRQSRGGWTSGHTEVRASRQVRVVRDVLRLRGEVGARARLAMGARVGCPVGQVHVLLRRALR